MQRSIGKMTLFSEILLAGCRIYGFCSVLFYLGGFGFDLTFFCYLK